MKKLLLLLFAAFSMQVSAQHYVWESFGENVYGNYGGGEAISRDHAGNLYVLASYEKAVAIQGDTIPDPGFNNPDLYLAKFNAQGQKISIKHFGSPKLDLALDMAIDDSANIYIFQHSYASNINMGDTIIHMVEGVVIKLDSSGNFKWASQIPYSCGRNIEISKGYLFVARCSGLYKLSLDSGIILSTLAYSIDGGPAGMCSAPNGDLLITYNNKANFSVGGFTITHTPSPIGDGGNIAILRVDTAMQVKSLKAYGYFTGTDNAPVAADSNNVYVVTPNYSTVYFGTDSILPNSCAFLKMDSLLNPVSTTELFNSANIETNALIMSGNALYLGGKYGNAFYLNNGDSLPPAVNGDNLIVKFDLNGNAIYGSGSGRQGATERINDLVADGNGNYYFSGLVYGGNPTYECNTQFVNPGMQLVAFNDSLYVVPQPTITQNGLLLTATTNFTETIQWYLNGIAIQGANGQQYTATQNGTYTVVYSNRFNCSKTSKAIVILNVGISDKQLESFSIYPNPFQNEVTVKLDEFSVPVTVTICDFSGRKLVQKEVSDVSQTFDMSAFSNGIYIFQFQNAKGIISKKVIKGN